MRAYLAFLKKEMMDVIRTYKLLILVIIFMLLGFMNPVTAKLLPALMENLMPAGMNLTMPESTIMDSWEQFFKNIPQMGLVVIVIMFNGLMTHEVSKGTLINMLTKGMKRRTVVTAKFTSAAIIWTGCYYLSFLITYFYNQLFWTQISIPGLAFAVICVWVFGLFVISAIILGGVLWTSNYGGMLFAGILVVIMLIINMLPKVSRWCPLQLMTVNMNLLKAEKVVSAVYPAMGVTVALTVGFLAMGGVVFNRRRI